MTTFDDEVSMMIRDCENREEKLSEWEAKFIDSIDNQIGKGNNLSPKQYETLERIWERVT